MTKVLLAVDGSQHSLRATRKLLELAEGMKERPQIVPVHVHVPLPRSATVKRVVGSNAVERYYREESEKAVQPSLKLLGKAGYAGKALLLVGPVAETLVSQARRGRFELIVLGTRGMGAAGNLLLGSVASKVLQLADVPVLTVR